MYFKRFLQLFLIYVLAALVLVGIVSTNFLQNKNLTFILALLISYAVLTLPLVLLTVLKTNKKQPVLVLKVKEVKCDVFWLSFRATLP